MPFFVKRATTYSLLLNFATLDFRLMFTSIAIQTLQNMPLSSIDLNYQLSHIKVNVKKL